MDQVCTGDVAVIIHRNYDRTEHDDFVLNVQPRMSSTDGAFPLQDENGNLFGWVIKPYCE